MDNYGLCLRKSQNRLRNVVYDSTCMDVAMKLFAAYNLSASGVEAVSFLLGIMDMFELASLW